MAQTACDGPLETGNEAVVGRPLPAGSWHSRVAPTLGSSVVATPAEGRGGTRESRVGASRECPVMWTRIRSSGVQPYPCMKRGAGKHKEHRVAKDGDPSRDGVLSGANRRCIGTSESH